MAIYGNTPSGTSQFFLGRVPPGAAGQVFNIHLFDIGDGATYGQHDHRRPATGLRPHLVLVLYRGRRWSVVRCPDCTISVNSSYNGKWQTISVPIPAGLHV